MAKIKEAIKIITKATKIFKEEGIKSFFKKTSVYIIKNIIKKLEFLILPYAFFKIKNLKQDCNLNELLSFVLEDCVGLIKPSQIKSEILGLLEILAKIKPKVFLEVGTANGGTLFLFSRVASKDGTMISVDLPRGKFGGGYPKWRESLYNSFTLSEQKLFLLRMDSHKEETLKQVKAILGMTKLDFLFIDGDHTYEGVKKDFEMYSVLVKQEGIIAFHDIVPGSGENVGGVPKFWEKIRAQYSGKEIVEDWGQGGYGIGILSPTRLG